MFTKANKARWLTIMAVRRSIRIERPDAPYLKTMPPTFQMVILERFQKMQKQSTVGVYDQKFKTIDVLENSRSTRRHEVQHAINHFASMYPACARNLPISVRITARFMRGPSWTLKAIGLILNETLAHWVHGDKKFLFNHNQYYLEKVAILSKPVCKIWGWLTPICIVFLCSTLYIFLQVAFTIIIRESL